MNDLDYKNKYLKYKSKYLKLKELAEKKGGAGDDKVYNGLHTVRSNGGPTAMEEVENDGLRAVSSNGGPTAMEEVEYDGLRTVSSNGGPTAMEEEYPLIAPVYGIPPTSALAVAPVPPVARVAPPGGIRSQTTQRRQGNVFVETTRDILENVRRRIEDYYRPAEVIIDYEKKIDKQGRPYIIYKYYDRGIQRSHLTIHLKPVPINGKYILGSDLTPSGAIHGVSEQDGDEYRTPILINAEGRLIAVTDETAQSVPGSGLLARHASVGTTLFVRQAVEALNHFGMLHY
jgi:hypothetical protein